MPLTQVVYTSRRADSLDRRALESLVRRSSDNNRLRDVTGVLLCHGRNILQLLEGDDAIVSALFDQIRLDPRHTHVRLLLKKEVRRRLFPEWGMRLAELGEKSPVCTERLARLLESVQSSADTSTLSLEARVLLNDFQQQVVTAA